MKGILQAVEQEEKLYYKVETVREFSYLGNSASAGEACEAAVTARTRWGWAMFRECGKLLHEKQIPAKLKGSAYHFHVRPAIQHGSEAWWLKKAR